MAAVSIYSLEGLSGLGGRLLFGVLADRLGAKRVLVAGLLVQALATGTYLFVSRLGEFYALSVIFGIAYGGVMPLYTVLAREFFGTRIMGTAFGPIPNGCGAICAPLLPKANRWLPALAPPPKLAPAGGSTAAASPMRMAVPLLSCRAAGGHSPPQIAWQRKALKAFSR